MLLTTREGYVAVTFMLTFLKSEVNKTRLIEANQIGVLKLDQISHNATEVVTFVKTETTYCTVCYMHNWKYSTHRFPTSLLLPHIWETIKCLLCFLIKTAFKLQFNFLQKSSDFAITNLILLGKSWRIHNMNKKGCSKSTSSDSVHSAHLHLSALNPTTTAITPLQQDIPNMFQWEISARHLLFFYTYVRNGWNPD